MVVRRVPEFGESRLTCACHAELRMAAALLEDRAVSGPPGVDLVEPLALPA